MECGTLLLLLPLPFPARTHHRLPKTAPPNSPSSLIVSPCSSQFLSPVLRFRRPSLQFSDNPNSWSCPCRSTSSGPPSPPDSDPPSGNDPVPSSGDRTKVSRFQDATRIFFAVLFWMSLFFWSSAWDGRNNGRSNKRSRF